MYATIYRMQVADIVLGTNQSKSAAEQKKMNDFPFQEDRKSVRKSDNLQYNMLACLVDVSFH